MPQATVIEVPNRNTPLAQSEHEKGKALYDAFIAETKPHPKGFAAMLRIHNEAQWIAEVIESLLPLCPNIYIMDDRSTDDTAAICGRYPGASVFPSPFTGLDEARDKNWLYGRVVEDSCPEWILCIDGDEVLEQSGPDKLREICDGSTANAYKLKILFLWNDAHTVRVDRIYDYFYRPSLFRPFYPNPRIPDEVTLNADFKWLSTPFGRKVDGKTPNLHCSSVPQFRLHKAPMVEVGLKHYGYMTREARVKKLDYYTSIDWLDRAEDSYRHMTQGDGVTLAELPLTQKLLSQGRISRQDVDFMLDTPPDKHLLHAGPMEFRAYTE